MEPTEKLDLSILVVDDEEGIRHGIRTFFKKKNFTVYAQENYSSAVAVAKKRDIDIAIVDIRLKEGKSGIDLIRELKKIEPNIIIIVITGFGSIDTAVNSMREGASDYIVKPIDNQKLLDAVMKNIEIHLLKTENVYLKNEILNRYTTHQFITKNIELELILKKVNKIKNSPVTVLITGETGTGKEVLARYIHYTSLRKDNKFIAINCAALSEELLLSELFGHERGAFTGAIKRKIGKFELAHGGTLFLDEIGDMSLGIQAKLLRVVEENSFERLGGTKKISVDVRIITATNRALDELINQGKFREDLYYRINIVAFTIAPLRERRDDIPVLIKHFIAKYNKLYQKRVIDLDESSYRLLKNHRWRGNVRELENVINQAVLLSEGEYITVNDLKKNNIFTLPQVEIELDYSSITSLKEIMLTISVKYEMKIIQRFLTMNNFNKSKTARDLSITRKTLESKIEKCGLQISSARD